MSHFSCTWYNPRLAQLTRSGKHIQYFEWAVIAGTLTGAWCSLKNITFQTSQYWLVILGIFCGTFIGMLRGINRGVKCSAYFSETSRGRGKIIVLLVALVLGKVIGSLFHWIYFVK